MISYLQHRLATSLDEVPYQLNLNKFIRNSTARVMWWVRNSSCPTDALVFMLSGQITFLRAPPPLSNAGSISFYSVYVIICKSYQNWTKRHKGGLIHSLMKYLQIIPTVKYFCSMTQCRVLTLNNSRLLSKPLHECLRSGGFHFR